MGRVITQTVMSESSAKHFDTEREAISFAEDNLDGKWKAKEVQS